jgi:hypothetical protein
MLDNAPHNVETDRSTLMNQDVAHAHPVHIGVARQEIIRDVTSRFADDLYVPHHGINGHFIHFMRVRPESVGRGQAEGTTERSDRR